ncbi:gamma-glutamyl-gamma-aminobutyrate hydrolase family protein [Amnibacterium sp.]|uniref:gamma-glutamyl-gamma-aminobutyrate hydrolase family protein n=1 Tax=Amnibacterium sp. TaxID=1872496 RepID=UPI0026208B8C|nr:gamma-glutamyl-gamma-aminobutyrate hydrolase family protein [Amnibacterium sp.]MCU1474116.1 gamma-glutamyl-gamma-aminobutyrate hydrolase family protein [Amnibacterium sp.]
MTAAKPLIGVTTSLEQADEKGWVGQYALVPEEYLLAVSAAGGVPLLLPPQPFDDAAVDRVLGVLDALVLSGGVDVDPALYGADRDPHTEPSRPQRDAWEQALVLAALERDLPVLAICRGVQLLDVALGGTLHQHLPGISAVSHGSEPSVFVPTGVTIEAGTRLAGILPAGEPITVRCHHHQALDRVAEGLVVTARSADGIIEAVESPAHRFALGVQWHPEQDTDLRLLEALVAAAS